jgi:hypothetical protein
VNDESGDERETACSVCGRPGPVATRQAQGNHALALCGVCIDELRSELDKAHEIPKEAGELRKIYHEHFRDPRRERQFLASVSFFATFVCVRLIVRSIRSGRGPFHNVSAGGRHIHHLVFGISLLLLIGFLWLMQIGTGVLRPRRWMRATAVAYGAGSAMTLDEFALWLNLSDVYFKPEGRESIDAVVLFGSLMSIGFWGQPFLKGLGKHLAGKIQSSAP